VANNPDKIYIRNKSDKKERIIELTLAEWEAWKRKWGKNKFIIVMNPPESARTKNKPVATQSIEKPFIPPIYADMRAEQKEKEATPEKKRKPKQNNNA
jgi:hypothetical protein